MRELKFRAYKDTLGMSEPFGLGVMPQWIKGHPRVMTVWTFPTSEVEVMQFAGLKDKNGVDIYQDDIVTAEWHWDRPHVIKLPEDYYHFQEYAIEDQMTVIGNIHQNKELLDANS